MTVLRETVSLNPGESKKVTFQFTPQIAKQYQVSVNGLTGSFTAITEYREPQVLSVYIPVVKIGTEYWPELRIFLPKPLNYEAGWHGGEWIPAGTIENPVYMVYLRDGEYIWEYNKYTLDIMSARLDPNMLTHADGIYNLRGEDGFNKPAKIWPFETVGLGEHDVLAHVTAFTGWWDGRGWGMTSPVINYPLGVVGKLVVA